MLKRSRWVAFDAARHVVRRGRRATALALTPLTRHVLAHTSSTLPNAPVLLFWIPEAGVTTHLAAMEILARATAEAGARPLFVRCHEVFGRCPVMDMHQLDEPTAQDSRRSVCRSCLTASVLMLGRYRLSSVNLAAFMPQARARVVEAEARRPSELQSFIFDGIAFGRIALHDLILANKIAHPDQVEGRLEAAWWERIKSCVLAYALADAICGSGQVSVLVHFNDAALQVSASLGAARHGVPQRSIAFSSHMGYDRRRLVIRDTSAHAAVAMSGREWPAWRGLALDAHTVALAGDDLVRHFTNPGGSSHIYSRGVGRSPDDLRGALGLRADRPVAVAYTSSLDEDVAAHAYHEALAIDSSLVSQSAFASQIEWLETLVETAEALRIQLIVRVHPREDANEREGVRSKHLDLLRSRFTMLPDSVRFVWPRESLSSYDLARLADVVTVSWSTIGLEMARAGTPVLATTVGKLHALPPGDAVDIAESPQDFVRRLAALLDAGPSVERVVAAYRWYAMRFLADQVVVDDLVKGANARRLPRWRTPRNSSALVGALTSDLSLLEMNRRLLEERQSADQSAGELRALSGQLGRLLAVVMGLPDPAHALRVYLSDRDGTAKHTSVGPDDRALVELVDGRTNLTWRGRSVGISSPMATRLSRLAVQLHRN